MKKALIIGATGLTGNILLKQLLTSRIYDTIEVWTRRPIDISHPTLTVTTVDFDAIANLRTDAQHLYCCIGSTIKKAGTKEKFKAIDLDLVARLATVAAQSGVKSMAVISSIGANKSSSNNYLRVKGQMEDAVSGAGVPSVTIVRPSMILGNRNEKRMGESVGKLLSCLISPLLVGSMRKYRGIQAHVIARAMVIITNEEHPGVSIVESDALAEIGR